MASKTEIANMAISHLGIGKEIANLETEKSEEAKACRRFYETAKEGVLADLDWSFATKFAVLNLIEENPSCEWRYSYKYPVDCINLRRILSGSRRDTQESRIPFRVVTDPSGKVIYTDKGEAEIEYTQNLTNASLFSSEFDLALSFRLASLVGARLTGGDPFKIKGDMLQQYEMELARAKKKNMNEETEDKPAESDLIRARGTSRDRTNYDRHEL
jgi:hypothetical protein